MIPKISLNSAVLIEVVIFFQGNQLEHLIVVHTTLF